MINYKQIDKSYFKAYDEIPMLVHVNSHYTLEKINNGLGGFTINEVNVKKYIKDLSKYEIACEYEQSFDISNWVFFMAFDEDIPVGAVTIVSKTDNVNMLEKRNDISVLWDIRVADDYKHKGIGQKLFDKATKWSRQQGFIQMKIECQNNNVPACKFYHKQGAILCKIDEYAYLLDESCKGEIQFIWYLNL